MSPTQIPPKTEARLTSSKVEFLQIYNVQREKNHINSGPVES